VYAKVLRYKAFGLPAPLCCLGYARSADVDFETNVGCFLGQACLEALTLLFSVEAFPFSRRDGLEWRTFEFKRFLRQQG
jgi:hypothetical protein